MSESGIPITQPHAEAIGIPTHANRTSGRHSSPLLHFARHLLEMIVSMMIGMFVGAAIFLTATGGLTPVQGMTRYPVLFVLVMAFAMTAPMIAWMRFRGHGARSCYEMTASMALPAVLLICLYWLGVISAPICGAYCGLSFVAMIVLMVYRRSDYAM
jgi:hypothetical protein